MLLRNELHVRARIHGSKWKNVLLFLLVPFFGGCASSGSGIVGQWEGVYPSADVVEFADDGTLLIAGTCTRGTFEQATEASVAVHVDDQTTIYTVVREDSRLILIDQLGHTKRYVPGGSRAKDALAEGCVVDDAEHDELARDAMRITMRELRIYHAGRKTYQGFDSRVTEGLEPDVRIRLDAEDDGYKLRASHKESSNEYYVIVRAESPEEAEIQLVPQGY